MVPSLHPDILRNIVHQSCGEDNGADTSKFDRQRQLAALMTVSKVFYEICTDDLYKDVLVHNPVSLFREVDISKRVCTKRRQVSKPKTLRICHSSIVDEPTYIELLNRLNRNADSARDAWNACGSLRHPHDPPISERQRWNRLRLDLDGANTVMNWLQMIKQEGLDVLPNLERVVMQGMVDDPISRRCDQYTKGLAELLTAHPSVKYHCQSSIYCPLSLSGMNYQPLDPPKIVTLHISQTPKIWEPTMTLPIMIGTTNRYICANPVKFAGTAPSTVNNNGHWIQALSILIMMIEKDGFVVRTKTDAEFAELEDGESIFDLVPFDSANLEGTTIELYNFVCDFITTARNADESEELVRAGIYPELRPLDYDIRQALARELDTVLHPKWKGRVVFRNLDEIPLCPACQIPDTAMLGYLTL